LAIKNAELNPFARYGESIIFFERMFFAKLFLLAISNLQII